MNEIILTLKKVTVQYSTKKVLDNVSLEIRKGKIITLIGPNGAGKTTLVKAALGLIKPTSGEVWRKPKLRIGYMPQALHIDPTLPISVIRFLRLLPGVTYDKAFKILKDVGSDKIANTPVQKLSGGEVQRVLLARAILRNPELLVLDEPVQGVDVAGQIELYALISRLRDEYQCSVLMVSHDLYLVISTADHVICLNHSISCSGHPKKIENDPAFMRLFGMSMDDVTSHQKKHIHDTLSNNRYEKS